jgi:hypothetical protein
MQRRKYLAAIGSLAAGGAAALGTGATPFMEADRDATIPVTNDNTALVALRPHQDSSVVRQRPDGELAIDMTQPGGEGVNVDSKYYLGEKGEDPAFTIHNQDDVEHDVTVGYETDRDSVNSARIYVWIWVGDTFSWNDPSSGYFTTSQGSASATVPVGSGEAVNVAIMIEAKDGASGDGSSDLSGEFQISAE